MRKHLYHFVRELHLGRDHYRDNRGIFNITKDIQPVVDLHYMHPVVDDTITVTSTGAGTTTVAITPKQRETWLLEYVTVRHDDAANRNIKLVYVGKNASMDFTSGGHSVVKNVETLVYPIFHDKLGTHDHIVGMKPLWLSGVLGPWSGAFLRFEFIALGNTKVGTIKYAYRRVL